MRLIPDRLEISPKPEYAWAMTTARSPDEDALQVGALSIYRHGWARASAGPFEM